MNKVVRNIIWILVVVAIVAGIVVYYQMNKFEYNDEDAVGNTAGNLYNGGLFCESDGYIYFANPNDSNQLYRMDEDGDNLKKLHSDKAQYINVYNDYIYYVRYNHDSGQEVVFRGNMFGVYRLKAGDTTAEALYDDGIANSLTLSGNKLYFQGYNDKDLIEVWSVGVDGKKLEKVSKDDYLPLSVYECEIYYNNVDGNHNIVKMDVEDNAKVTVKAGNYFMPIVEDGVLYYIDVEAGYQLKKEDLATGEQTVITEDKCVNYNVSTEYEVIYYQCENDETDHRLMMTDLDGNDAKVVGIGDFKNIHITKNFTYYYEITVGDDADLYYVETGETPDPKKFD